MAASSDHPLGVLTSPERNHFFYGKLMDVTQFQKEQRYFNHKRWLLNRLVLGSGVIRGLNVIEDPETAGMLRIERGVALDDWGREIVVPEHISVNPRALANEQGDPVEEAGPGDTVVIELAYREANTDPVPVLVPDCRTSTGTHSHCANRTVVERFRILVRRAEGTAPPPAAQPLGEFPLPAGDALHPLLCELLSSPLSEPLPAPCASPPDPPVMLARVTIGQPITIDPCSDRRLVYGTALIYELLLGLSARVEDLAQGRILSYHAGDGQTGPPRRELTGPLEVQLVDVEGNGITGQTVEFRVTEGGGTLAISDPERNETSVTTKTNETGMATARWTLGADGFQRVEASAVGSVFRVTLRAKIERDG
jgi:hypothetical protein